MIAQKAAIPNFDSPPSTAPTFHDAEHDTSLLIDCGGASTVHILQQRLINTYDADQSLGGTRSGRNILLVTGISLALWGVIGAVSYSLSMATGLL